MLTRSAERMRVARAAVIPGCMLVCAALAPAFAREDESRRVADEARKVLAATEGAPAALQTQAFFDYGVWLNYRFIEYRDEDNDASVADATQQLHWIDSRFWFTAALNDQYVFLRVKDLMTESLPEDTAGGWDHDGPHLEYAYASMEVRPFRLKLGRKYFSVGQGLVFGDDHDGAEVLLLHQAWRLKAFLARTLPSEENIDASVPGYDKGSRRYFYGFEYGYSGLPGQDLYCYALAQKDDSDPRPEDPGHEYRYDSQYWGAGARGEFARVFSYRAEAVKESGRSAVYDTGERKRIDAWAGVTQLNCEPRLYMHPQVCLEYAYGSGDADRSSVTDTLGGNVSGTDRNFLYFGYFPTSYALFPRLSNLHVYRAGLSLRPLEANAVFTRLGLSVDWYRFYKDKAEGGIYDAEASHTSSDVGSEVDLTVGWRVFSDLGFIARWGHFMPADAYAAAANDNEDYFSMSVSLTF